MNNNMGLGELGKEITFANKIRYKIELPGYLPEWLIQRPEFSSLYKEENNELSVVLIQANLLPVECKFYNIISDLDINGKLDVLLRTYISKEQYLFNTFTLKDVFIKYINFGYLDFNDPEYFQMEIGLKYKSGSITYA